MKWGRIKFELRRKLIKKKCCKKREKKCGKEEGNRE